jgi:uncharacterized protein YyaL (SSP411 family)
VLFQAREQRVRPGWDDKVLADWNGLAIAALARASVVFDQPVWLDRARQAFDFIIANMTARHGGVEHAWRLGRVSAPGLIEDQAAIARAALALHEAIGHEATGHKAAGHEATGNEAPGDRGYLAKAQALVNAAQSAFADGHGGVYSTAADASDVPLTRPRTAADNATPAGNGLMAEVLARLFHLTGDPAWRARATAVLRAFAGQPDQLTGMPTLLVAADLLEEGAGVAIIGEAKAAAELAQAALSAPDPAVVVVRASGTDALPPAHPAFGKTAGPHAAVAYVCRRNVCSLPIADPAALSQALAARRQTNT